MQSVNRRATEAPADLTREARGSILPAGMDTAPPSRFIGEAIAPIFDLPPLLLKKPGCPDGFVWRGHTFRVTELVAEWSDFARRGAMEHNMRPGHAAAAAKRGSWGVGRYHFRVRTNADRVFEIYYDRAPRPGGRTKQEREKRGLGSWVVWSEVNR
jgi:hypothetical protein